MRDLLIIIHIFVIVAMSVIVLLQNSESSVLGIGGSSSGSGMHKHRSRSPLSKLTWWMAFLFMATSMTLSVSLPIIDKKPSVIVGDEVIPDQSINLDSGLSNVESLFQEELPVQDDNEISPLGEPENSSN